MNTNEQSTSSHPNQETQNQNQPHQRNKQPSFVSSGAHQSDDHEPLILKHDRNKSPKEQQDAMIMAFQKVNANINDDASYKDVVQEEYIEPNVQADSNQARHSQGEIKIVIEQLRTQAQNDFSTPESSACQIQSLQNSANHTNEIDENSYKVSQNILKCKNTSDNVKKTSQFSQKSAGGEAISQMTQGNGQHNHIYAVSEQSQQQSLSQYTFNPNIYKNMQAHTADNSLKGKKDAGFSSDSKVIPDNKQEPKTFAKELINTSSRSGNTGRDETQEGEQSIPFGSQNIESPLPSPGHDVDRQSNLSQDDNDNQEDQVCHSLPISSEKKSVTSSDNESQNKQEEQQTIQAVEQEVTQLRGNRINFQVTKSNGSNKHSSPVQPVVAPFSDLVQTDPSLNLKIEMQEVEESDDNDEYEESSSSAGESDQEQAQINKEKGEDKQKSNRFSISLNKKVSSDQVAQNDQQNGDQEHVIRVDDEESVGAEADQEQDDDDHAQDGEANNQKVESDQLRVNNEQDPNDQQEENCLMLSLIKQSKSSHQLGLEIAEIQENAEAEDDSKDSSPPNKEELAQQNQQINLVAKFSTTALHRMDPEDDKFDIKESSTDDQKVLNRIREESGKETDVMNDISDNKLEVEEAKAEDQPQHIEIKPQAVFNSNQPSVEIKKQSLEVKQQNTQNENNDKGSSMADSEDNEESSKSSIENLSSKMAFQGSSMTQNTQNPRSSTVKYKDKYFKNRKLQHGTNTQTNLMSTNTPINSSLNGDCEPQGQLQTATATRTNSKDIDVLGIVGNSTVRDMNEMNSMDINESINGKSIVKKGSNVGSESINNKINGEKDKHVPPSSYGRFNIKTKEEQMTLKPKLKEQSSVQVVFQQYTDYEVEPSAGIEDHEHDEDNGQIRGITRPPELSIRINSHLKCQDWHSPEVLREHKLSKSFNHGHNASNMSLSDNNINTEQPNDKYEVSSLMHKQEQQTDVFQKFIRIISTNQNMNSPPVKSNQISQHDGLSSCNPQFIKSVQIEKNDLSFIKNEEGSQVKNEYRTNSRNLRNKSGKILYENNIIQEENTEQKRGPLEVGSKFEEQKEPSNDQKNMGNSKQNGNENKEYEQSNLRKTEEINQNGTEKSRKNSSNYNPFNPQDEEQLLQDYPEKTDQIPNSEKNNQIIDKESDQKEEASDVNKLTISLKQSNMLVENLGASANSGQVDSDDPMSSEKEYEKDESSQVQNDGSRSHQKHTQGKLRRKNKQIAHQARLRCYTDNFQQAQNQNNEETSSFHEGIEKRNVSDNQVPTSKKLQIKNSSNPDIQAHSSNNINYKNRADGIMHEKDRENLPQKLFKVQQKLNESQQSLSESRNIQSKKYNQTEKNNELSEYIQQSKKNLRSRHSRKNKSEPVSAFRFRELNSNSHNSKKRLSAMRYKQKNQFLEDEELKAMTDIDCQHREPLNTLNTINYSNNEFYDKLSAMKYFEDKHHQDIYTNTLFKGDQLTIQAFTEERQRASSVFKTRPEQLEQVIDTFQKFPSQQLDDSMVEVSDKLEGPSLKIQNEESLSQERGQRSHKQVQQAKSKKVKVTNKQIEVNNMDQQPNTEEAQGNEDIAAPEEGDGDDDQVVYNDDEDDNSGSGNASEHKQQVQSSANSNSDVEGEGEATKQQQNDKNDYHNVNQDSQEENNSRSQNPKNNESDEEPDVEEHLQLPDAQVESEELKNSSQVSEKPDYQGLQEAQQISHLQIINQKPQLRSSELKKGQMFKKINNFNSANPSEDELKDREVEQMQDYRDTYQSVNSQNVQNNKIEQIDELSDRNMNSEVDKRMEQEDIDINEGNSTGEKYSINRANDTVAKIQSSATGDHSEILTMQQQTQNSIAIKNQAFQQKFQSTSNDADYQLSASPEKTSGEGPQRGQSGVQNVSKLMQQISTSGNQALCQDFDNQQDALQFQIQNKIQMQCFNKKNSLQEQDQKIRNDPMVMVNQSILNYENPKNKNLVHSVSEDPTHKQVEFRTFQQSPQNQGQLQIPSQAEYDQTLQTDAADHDKRYISSENEESVNNQNQTRSKNPNNINQVYHRKSSQYEVQQHVRAINQDLFRAQVVHEQQQHPRSQNYNPRRPNRNMMIEFKPLSRFISNHKEKESAHSMNQSSPSPQILQAQDYRVYRNQMNKMPPQQQQQMMMQNKIEEEPDKGSMVNGRFIIHRRGTQDEIQDGEQEFQNLHRQQQLQGMEHLHIQDINHMHHLASDGHRDTMSSPKNSNLTYSANNLDQQNISFGGIDSYNSYVTAPEQRIRSSQNSHYVGVNNIQKQSQGGKMYPNRIQLPTNQPGFDRFQISPTFQNDNYSQSGDMSFHQNISQPNFLDQNEMSMHHHQNNQMLDPNQMGGLENHIMQQNQNDFSFNNPIGDQQLQLYQQIVSYDQQQMILDNMRFQQQQHTADRNMFMLQQQLHLLKFEAHKKLFNLQQQQINSNNLGHPMSSQMFNQPTSIQNIKNEIQKMSESIARHEQNEVRLKQKISEMKAMINYQGQQLMQGGPNGGGHRNGMPQQYWNQQNPSRSHDNNSTMSPNNINYPPQESDQVSSIASHNAHNHLMSQGIQTHSKDFNPHVMIPAENLSSGVMSHMNHNNQDAYGYFQPQERKFPGQIRSGTQSQQFRNQFNNSRGNTTCQTTSRMGTLNPDSRMGGQSQDMRLGGANAHEDNMTSASDHQMIHNNTRISSAQGQNRRMMVKNSNPSLQNHSQITHSQTLQQQKQAINPQLASKQAIRRIMTDQNQDDKNETIGGQDQQMVFNPNNKQEMQMKMANTNQLNNHKRQSANQQVMMAATDISFQNIPCAMDPMMQTIQQNSHGNLGGVDISDQWQNQQQLFNNNVYNESFDVPMYGGQNQQQSQQMQYIHQKRSSQKNKTLPLKPQYVINDPMERKFTTSAEWRSGQFAINEYMKHSAHQLHENSHMSSHEDNMEFISDDHHEPIHQTNKINQNQPNQQQINQDSRQKKQISAQHNSMKGKTTIVQGKQQSNKLSDQR